MTIDREFKIAAAVDEAPVTTDLASIIHAPGSADVFISFFLYGPAESASHRKTSYRETR